MGRLGGTNRDGAAIYFEFTRVGSVVKVVAMDSATGTEVSVFGPVHASQYDLERLARRKLEARLQREAAR
jgi:hypothetical protein